VSGYVSHGVAPQGYPRVRGGHGNLGQSRLGIGPLGEPRTGVNVALAGRGQHAGAGVRGLCSGQRIVGRMSTAPSVS
jgi:hypothetical protein